MNRVGNFRFSYLGKFGFLLTRNEEPLNEAMREPEGWGRLYASAIIHCATGRWVEVDTALHQLIAIFTKAGAYQIAVVYAARGETDLAFQWL